MKRKILSVLVVLVMVLTALTACFGRVADEGAVTVVIENRDGTFTEYTLELEGIENKSEGVAGLLEMLASRDTDPLALDMQDSSFGKYINSIGSLVPDAEAGEYVSIYTSVEADFGVSENVKEFTYKGTLLKTASVGVSQLQVPADAVFLFRIDSFS